MKQASVDYLVFGESASHSNTGYKVLEYSAGLSPDEHVALSHRASADEWLAANAGDRRFFSFDVLPRGRVAFTTSRAVQTRDGRLKALSLMIVFEASDFSLVENPFSFAGPERCFQRGKETIALDEFWRLERYEYAPTHSSPSLATEIPGDGHETDLSMLLDSALPRMGADLEQWTCAITEQLMQGRRVVLGQTKGNHLEDVVRIVWLSLPLADRLQTPFSNHMRAGSDEWYRIANSDRPHKEKTAEAGGVCDMNWERCRQIAASASPAAVLFADWTVSRTKERSLFNACLERTGRSWLDQPDTLDRFLQFQKLSSNPVRTPGDLGLFLKAAYDDSGRLEPWADAAHCFKVITGIQPDAGLATSAAASAWGEVLVNVAARWPAARKGEFLEQCRSNAVLRFGLTAEFLQSAAVPPEFSLFDFMTDQEFETLASDPGTGRGLVRYICNSVLDAAELSEKSVDAALSSLRRIPSSIYSFRARDGETADVLSSALGRMLQTHDRAVSQALRQPYLYSSLADTLVEMAVSGKLTPRNRFTFEAVMDIALEDESVRAGVLKSAAVWLSRVSLWMDHDSGEWNWMARHVAGKPALWDAAIDALEAAQQIRFVVGALIFSELPAMAARRWQKRALDRIRANPRLLSPDEVPWTMLFSRHPNFARNLIGEFVRKDISVQKIQKAVQDTPAEMQLAFARALEQRCRTDPSVYISADTIAFLESLSGKFRGFDRKAAIAYVRLIADARRNRGGRPQPGHR